VDDVTAATGQQHQRAKKRKHLDTNFWLLAETSIPGCNKNIWARRKFDKRGQIMGGPTQK
jgi:hypothetical protein